METTPAPNRRLAKVAVQCPADTFVVNQSWFSASTFVVKIATLAKRQNVTSNFMTEQATYEIITNKDLIATSESI